jgi:hypothetical protein
MSDISAINYEPLEAEKRAYRMVFKRFWVRSSIIWGIAVAVGIFVPVVGMTVALAWLIVLLLQVNGFQDGLWEEFAIINDWPLDAVSDPFTLIPLSLQFGYDQAYSSAITAQLGVVSTDMVVYVTTVDEGRAQRHYSFTVARIQLPAALPHILLRAKGDRVNIQQDFADHEMLQLEGDFGDYFTLQIEKGQEVNVLEVITPDVMQTLVDYSQHEDIEIADDNLYFIVKGDARNADAIRQLIDSAASLSERIVEHVQQVTPDVPVLPMPQTTGLTS